MNPDAIRKFFRENPRAWIVGAVAVLTLILAVWGIWGGFSLQFSRFFAAAAPPAFIVNNPGPISHGQKLSVSWSATDAVRCDAQSWFDTGGANQGTAESAPVDACAAAATNQVGISCTYADNSVGTAVRTFTVDKTTCPAASPTPTPGQSPPPGGVPVDPTGNCVWRVEPNAQSGGWFCKALNCPLLGNPPNLPPAGPATSMAVKLFRGTCDNVHNIFTPIVGCNFVLDGTPKTGGLEGYPPKDPLWTCTGPFDLGRDGHDYFDCYNPRGIPTGTAPITCCANTGLSGDCITFTATNSPGGSVTPAPSGQPFPSGTIVPQSPTPTPPAYAPLACSPAAQTVAIGQNATVNAVGGNGIYQWTLTGSGVQEGGTTSAIDVSYSVSGPKVVRVASAGASVGCSVTVLGSGGTLSPVSVVKRGFLGGGAYGGESSSISVNPNEIARFSVSVTNDSSSPVNGVSVLDSVPPGMSYQSGSTAVDGQSVTDDSITNSGLSLGTIQNGVRVNVQWSAGADETSQLAAGPQQTRPRVRVSADGFSDVNTDMSVTVYGSGFAGSTETTGNTGGGTTGGNGTTGTAGGVSTGPGDAVILALVMAAALTLLYSGYTRSSAYRRREADAVSRDQGPMDFRS